MRPIDGYEQAPAFTGETINLPAGLYKLVIKQVNVIQDKNNREMMVLCFDILEGSQKDGYVGVNYDYKDFYDKQFKLRRQSDPNTKWGGIYRQLTHGDSLPFFKGIITSIEKSNPGYRWNWDERTLVGKVVGGIFQREEFLTSDGQKKMATKCIQMRSMDGLKDAKVPADNLLAEGSVGGNTTGIGQPPSMFDNGFVNVPDNSSDEGVPFM